jgi:ribosome-associated heat shock protein Hsp15
VEPKPEPVRLDIWLDVACLFKTRSEAQKACKGGKVDVNGKSAPPHRQLHPGDIINITRPLGRRQRVVVKALTEKHIPKAEARLLYEDTTPPPSPEEKALLDLIRLAGPRRRPGPVHAPDRDERRRLRAAKESGG